ncbi:hypothetical protein LINPERPRIM_LOCUS21613, partial [Linum perenne]
MTAAAACQWPGVGVEAMGKERKRFDFLVLFFFFMREEGRKEMEDEEDERVERKRERVGGV